MARKLRVQYPGVIYHVMNRGDRREPIFNDDQDGYALMHGRGHTRCVPPPTAEPQSTEQ
jgi:hypothetical protein